MLQLEKKQKRKTKSSLHSRSIVSHLKDLYDRIFHRHVDTTRSLCALLLSTINFFLFEKIIYKIGYALNTQRVIFSAFSLFSRIRPSIDKVSWAPIFFFVRYSFFLLLFHLLITTKSRHESGARLFFTSIMLYASFLSSFPFHFSFPSFYVVSSTHYRLLLLCCILFNMDFVYFSLSIRAISITSHMLLACSRRLLIINIIIVTLNYPFVYLFIALLISVQQQLISCCIISCSVSFFIIPSFHHTSPFLFCVFRHISLG